MKQKDTLHLLTFGLHVTQNKFVARILFIFHKLLMIPVIPKLQVAYTGLSIKSREKTIVRASYQRYKKMEMRV